MEKVDTGASRAILKAFSAKFVNLSRPRSWYDGPHSPRAGGGGGGAGGAMARSSAEAVFDWLEVSTREPVTVRESEAACSTAGSGGDEAFVSTPDPAQEARKRTAEARTVERSWHRMKTSVRSAGKIARQFLRRA